MDAPDGEIRIRNQVCPEAVADRIAESILVSTAPPQFGSIEPCRTSRDALATQPTTAQRAFLGPTRQPSGDSRRWFRPDQLAGSIISLDPALVVQTSDADLWVVGHGSLGIAGLGMAKYPHAIAADPAVARATELVLACCRSGDHEDDA